MLPTFILTRTFAISALFVGAAQVSYAAPITKRYVGFCHLGCMFAEPTPSTAATPVSAVAPLATAISEIIEIIEVPSAALGTPVDVVHPVFPALGAVPSESPSPSEDIAELLTEAISAVSEPDPA